MVLHWKFEEVWSCLWKRNVTSRLLNQDNAFEEDITMRMIIRMTKITIKRMIKMRMKRMIGLNIVRMGMMRMVLLIMMIISYLMMSILFALLSHHRGYQLSSYLKSKRSSRYRQKYQDLLSEYYYQLTWASSSWELRMFATRNIKRSWPFLKLITFKCFMLIYIIDVLKHLDGIQIFFFG